MSHDSNRPKGPGDDAQEVDIGDVDVSDEPRGTRPPPLPPNLTGPSAPGGAPLGTPPAPMMMSSASQPPAYTSQPPAYASQQPPQQKPRSPMLYIILIVAFVVVGLGGGAVVAFVVRKPAPAPVAAPAKPTATQQGPAVITIPTVDMNDDRDGGQ